MDKLLKISQQTLWQILGKVATSTSTIIILGLVSRNYGESGTGIFTLVLTYLAFFYLAADFGINAHILPRVQLEWRKLLGLRLVWSVMLAILSIIITPLLPFNNSTFSQAVLFGALAIIGSAVFITSNAIFQSRLRYDLSVTASAVGVLGGFGLITWGILNHLPIPYLVFGHMVGWILTAVLSLLLAKRFIKFIWPIVDLSYIRSTLIEAWPISATLVLNVVYFRVDSFILTSYKSFADVGVYNLAYQVFQSVLVLPTFIMNSYYPIMLRQFNSNIDRFKSYLVKACLLMFGLSISGTLATLLLSPLAIQLLTGGKGFFGSVDSLKILSLGFPAYFVSSVLMWVMVTIKKYKQMVLVYLIGLLTNLGLNLLLIPQYSYIASSYITGISEYLILFLQIIILFRIWKK